MRVCSRVEWRQRCRLLDESERLTRLLEELRVASTSRSDYEPHDVTDDEAAIQADAVENRLAVIGRAIDRLDLGTYGVCLRCGATIGDERLEALPAAAWCRPCAV